MNYIDDWKWHKHTKQLDRMHTLYAAYCDYAGKIMKENPKSPELTPVPAAQYISILGKASLFDKALETFHLMDSDGPLSADHRVYTSLFQTIGRRQTRTQSSSISPQEQNARDVTFFWKEMEQKAMEGRFEVDSHTLFAALNVLRKGREEDLQFAMNLAEEYLGFVPPGVPEPTEPKTAKFGLSPANMQAILLLCNSLRRYELCEYYVNKVKSSHDGEFLDKRNIETLFYAYSRMPVSISDPSSKKVVKWLEWMFEKDVLGKSMLRPTRSTFRAALMVCWNDRDWESALRVYELMTGVHISSFLESNPPSSSKTEGAALNKLLADPITFSYLTRIARASEDPVKIMHCIRLFYRFGGVPYMLVATHAKEKLDEWEDRGSLRFQIKYISQYQKIIAEDIIEMSNSTLSNRPPIPGSERVVWQKQLQFAKIALLKLTGTKKQPGLQGDDLLTLQGDTYEYLPGAIMFKKALAEKEKKKKERPKKGKRTKTTKQSGL